MEASKVDRNCEHICELLLANRVPLDTEFSIIEMSEAIEDTLLILAAERCGLKARDIKHMPNATLREQEGLTEVYDQLMNKFIGSIDVADARIWENMIDVMKDSSARMHAVKHAVERVLSYAK